MRTTLALLASASTLAVAQQFFTSTDVPGCAFSCTQLNQAQQACLPPAPQPTTCFCSSAYLTNLATAPQSVCPQCTAQSDLSQLTGWFTNFCQNGGSASYNPSAASSSAAPTAASTSAAPAGTSSAADPNATSDGSGDASASTGQNDDEFSDTGPEKSWWDLHKGWMAMVIVLILGFSIIIAAGVWWKKRHTKKRNAAGTTLPGAWGPSGGPTDSPRTTDQEKFGRSESPIEMTGSNRTSRFSRVLGRS